MSPRPMAENKPLQISELRRQMQQRDAEWDELTQSIDAEKQRLADAQQHLANFRLLLVLGREQPSSPAMALTAREAALERQVALLQQSIALKVSRRNGIARQFDQARLALAALRKPPPEKQHTHAARARKLLLICTRRVLHALWWVCHQPAKHGEIMPGDAFLWPQL